MSGHLGFEPQLYGAFWKTLQSAISDCRLGRGWSCSTVTSLRSSSWLLNNSTFSKKARNGGDVQCVLRYFFLLVLFTMLKGQDYWTSVHLFKQELAYHGWLQFLKIIIYG